MSLCIYILNFLHYNLKIPSTDFKARLHKCLYNLQFLYHKCPTGCETQMASQCLLTPTFRQAILTRKVGQTDLFLAV